MNELNKKLAKIQQDLKAPKGQFNKFGNYNYRSCEDILESVKPLLKDLTLVISDEVVVVDTGFNSNTGRFYVKATVTISDGTNTISASALAREAEDKKGMDDAQITGSASSYARKYALNGLFAIDDTKDADTQDNTGKVSKSVEGSTKGKKTVAERAKARAKKEPDTKWRDAKASDNQLAWVDKKLKGYKYTDYTPADLKKLNAGIASDVIGNKLDIDDLIKLIEKNKK